MSHLSRHRLSQYSAGSASRSRPVSTLFVSLTPSLPYTIVRDFAYPSTHPLHYGPPAESSQPPSAVDSQRRMSEPQVQWERMPWETWGDPTDADPIRTSTAQFVDGPPWSEDEDLHSPIVSLRHRKSKTSSSPFASSKRTHARQDDPDSAVIDPKHYDRERGGYYVGTGTDGSKRYYMNDGAEANGPGGEYVTFPPDAGPHGAAAAAPTYQLRNRQPRKFADHENYLSDSEESSPGSNLQDDASRYSRDYQFTITSPDEEMHGKAVALYDFESENENELPLVEGQIIWVSYRHGQGWLVAKDPKTQENGLVPEAYVRLLRDIEGGMNSLTGTPSFEPASPHEAGTPTQAEHNLGIGGQTPTPASVANGYHQPVVSTFSTSSKDLDLYPTNQLGIHAGQAPPQVVHYHGQRGGSQSSTPVLTFNHDMGFLQRENLDYSRKGSDPNVTPIIDDAKTSSGAILPGEKSELAPDRMEIDR